MQGYFAEVNNTNGRGAASIKMFDEEKVDHTPLPSRRFWFNRCAADDSETFQNIAPGQVSNGRVERDFLLKRSRINEFWDAVKIIRRGKCGICELVSVEGTMPGAALILR